MGFIRGFFLFFIVGLLFVSLFAGNLFLTLTLSLTYDNVNTELSSAVSDIVKGEVEGKLADLGITESDLNLTEEVEDRMDDMEEYCENETDETEYVFSYEDYTFEVPCEKVGQGTEAVIEESVENAVERIYYKSYDCEFFDCINQGEFYILISEEAKIYWKSKFYITLIASIVLAALALLLTQRKRNYPIILGILMAVSAIPFVKAETWIISLGSSTYLSFVSIFISEAPRVFWIMFIPGVVLIVLGIVLHFAFAGAKMKTWLEERQKAKEQKAKVKQVEKKVVKKK